MLLVRAILAFLALPTIAGFVVPWLLVRSDPWRGGGCSAGASLAALGAAGLVWCVRDFYAVGRGTLAPWSPPRRLVAVGLYRVVRNPMYVSVVALVAGTAWWRTSPWVGAYATVLAVAFHLRVVLYEEPWLERNFPEEWRAYAAEVRRWVPRLRPWRGAAR
jgi:protein-S-isoprenylcysteine O-methyltransferase Ste14